MRWLIDGYNVIRRDPHLRGREAESLETGRRALIHLIAPAARRSRDEFIVVFDGARVAGGGEPGGQVRVLFSRPPESADDVVIRLAGQWREGAIVVSSDRTVRSAAGRVGSPVVGVEEFLAALEPGAPPDDDGEEPGTHARGGNPHRPSKAARATQRALRRLRAP